MEFDGNFWVDYVDLSNSVQEKFLDIYLKSNFESEDHLEICEIEKSLFLEKSDFLEKKVSLKVKFSEKKIIKNVQKVEEVKYEEGNVEKIENFDFGDSIKRILTAQPVEIEFHNFRLDKQYKRIVVIKNVSKMIARYKLAKRFDASKLRVIWKTRSGDREDLAPGMSTTLTFIYKAKTPEDYNEKIVINVEGGLPVIIDVIAHRDPPILIGKNYSEDAFFPPNIINERDDLFHHQLNLPLSPKRGSLTFLSNDDELECNDCLVGDEKIIEIKLTNFGTSGRFFLISEANWHSKNITNLTDTLKLITTSFTLWPSYFHLERNQSLPLKLFFTPNTDGLHVEKIFIISDNLSLQSFEILGDGIMFNWDFIHFDPNLRKQTVCSTELEDNKFCNFFIIELETEKISVQITISNLSQFNMNYRWQIINDICLSVLPSKGIFPGFTTLTFTIYSINYELCSEFVESNLQFIIEDLPFLAIPEEYKDFIEESRVRRRRCEHSVDICVANVGVCLPSRSVSIIPDSFSSEESHGDEEDIL